MNNVPTYEDVLQAKRNVFDAVNKLTVISTCHGYETNRLTAPPSIKETIRFFPTGGINKKHKKGALINGIVDYLKEVDCLVTVEQIFQYLYGGDFKNSPASLLRQQIKDRFTKDKKKVFRAFVSFRIEGTNKYLYGLADFIDDNGNLKDKYQEKIKGQKAPLKIQRWIVPASPPSGSNAP